MNFLKELEKKGLHWVGNELQEIDWSWKYRIKPEVSYVYFEDVKKLWRSFWLERKKEIEKRLNACEEIQSRWMNEHIRVKTKLLRKELPWIEKQLKEK